MIHVALFGKFELERDGKELAGCNSAKADELFCFLLLHRDRPHAREKLASLLWGEHCTTARARKYLRNSLWRLQTTLDDQQEHAFSDVLLVEPDWIHFRTSPKLSSDVMAFENAYAAVKGKAGHTLTELEAHNLELAIRQYRGYLLENWYQDWCLFERERLHQIYLMMLDKLMSYCDAHGRYEEGLSYGRRILQYDRAREHSHRHMMLLYMRSGNRTGALRQYSDCVATLKEEFDIEPSERTHALYKRIRATQHPRDSGAPSTRSGAPATRSIPHAGMSQVLRELHEIRESLSEMQRQILHATEAAERALERRQPDESDRSTSPPDKDVHAIRPQGSIADCVEDGSAERSLPRAATSIQAENSRPRAATSVQAENSRPDAATSAQAENSRPEHTGESAT